MEMVCRVSSRRCFFDVNICGGTSRSSGIVVVQWCFYLFLAPPWPWKYDSSDRRRASAVVGVARRVLDGFFFGDVATHGNASDEVDPLFFILNVHWSTIKYVDQV